jgi:hypothetical protein
MFATYIYFLSRKRLYNSFGYHQTVCAHFPIPHTTRPIKHLGFDWFTGGFIGFDKYTNLDCGLMIAEYALAKHKNKI